MEAKLLSLQDRGNNEGWTITNGTGVLISQAQVPRKLLTLFTTDPVRRQIVGEMTKMLAEPSFNIVEQGWSAWFVRDVEEDDCPLFANGFH